jgi:putative peptide zinc metalloprotease protein
LVFDPVLASLREDLNLYSSGNTRAGYPSWTIHDPVQNKFFQIEWTVLEVLRRWGNGSAELIVDAVNKETAIHIDESFVYNVESFLFSNELCQSNDKKHNEFLINYRKNKKISWFSWLIHHYLFFRIPLFKSDKFLSYALRYVRFIFSSWFLLLSAVCLILGLFLVARQWELFTSELIDFYSVQGFLGFFFTLIFVKIAHEFGHGFVAKFYGCKVPTMGVAFLLLWPMFYTDTTESWKLSLSSKRFNIARAGLTVELLIASFATLAWSFLPTGVLRDISVILATVTWISSLAINASPFMRFDGYFLLSDFWEIPNLHERSAKLARWWLRESLFKLEELPPELFPQKTKTLLILFAFCTWIYRLVLFIGIAILVYNFFFKALGVLLFITEIYWFIFRPIWLEIGEWRLRKTQIFLKKRVWVLLSFSVMCLSFLFIPLNETLTINAVIQGKPFKSIFVRVGGRLDGLLATEGQFVKKGQLIARLVNPSLDSELRLIKNRLMSQQKLKQLAALDQGAWKYNAVISAEIARLETETIVLTERLKSLLIYAPIDGIVTDIVAGMFVGQWLGDGHQLFDIRGDEGFKITAYISEENVSRIENNSTCRFSLSQWNYRKYLCKLVSIERSSAIYINEKMLVSLYGGNISANYVGKKLIPEQAHYKIRADIDKYDINIKQKLMGTVEIDAVHKSLFQKFRRWAIAVIVRETGM